MTSRIIQQPAKPRLQEQQTATGLNGNSLPNYQVLAAVHLQYRGDTEHGAIDGCICVLSSHLTSRQMAVVSCTRHSCRGACTQMSVQTIRSCRSDQQTMHCFVLRSCISELVNAALHHATMKAVLQHHHTLQVIVTTVHTLTCLQEAPAPMQASTHGGNHVLPACFDDQGHCWGCRFHHCWWVLLHSGHVPLHDRVANHCVCCVDLSFCCGHCCRWHSSAADICAQIGSRPQEGDPTACKPYVGSCRIELRNKCITGYASQTTYYHGTLQCHQ